MISIEKTRHCPTLKLPQGFSIEGRSLKVPDVNAMAEGILGGQAGIQVMHQIDSEAYDALLAKLADREIYKVDSLRFLATRALQGHGYFSAIVVDAAAFELLSKEAICVPCERSGPLLLPRMTLRHRESEKVLTVLAAYLPIKKGRVSLSSAKTLAMVAQDLWLRASGAVDVYIVGRDVIQVIGAVEQ
ncbi:MAG: hypothetical protein KDK78_05385 [Chlamydiia bacterium]|nr:hypothetical protein [Chlamydiia bacterium]